MSAGPLVLLIALSVPATWFLIRLVANGAGEGPILAAVPFDPRQWVMAQGALTVGFVIIGARFADRSMGVIGAMAVLLTVLLALAVIDMRTYRLPDRIVVPMLCGSIVWISVVSFIDGDRDAMGAALSGAILYFLVLFLAHLISPRGMGFGDVKLAAILGLFLGWEAGTPLDAVVLVLWAMIIGFASGTAVGLIILIRRRSNRPFPFGPFLALGTVLALLASSRFLG